jgi:hypothetical protein
VRIVTDLRNTPNILGWEQLFRTSEILPLMARREVLTRRVRDETISGFRRIREIGWKRLGALVQRRMPLTYAVLAAYTFGDTERLLIASAGCLESQDRINREHELAAAHAIVKRASTEGVFISHFGSRRDQLGESVGDSHGPTLVGCRKPRSFALLVDQNVQRAKREEVLL